MKTQAEINNSLNAIRKVIDSDVMGCDIDTVKNKMIQLTQLTGLSAEANASSKKMLHQKELEVLMSLDKKIQPSIAAKMLKARCNEEEATLEYADRLNSALVHTIDALRTAISLYKSELENSLKQ